MTSTAPTDPRAAAVAAREVGQGRGRRVDGRAFDPACRLDRHRRQGVRRSPAVVAVHRAAAHPGPRSRRSRSSSRPSRSGRCRAGERRPGALHRPVHHRPAGRVDLPARRDGPVVHRAGRRRCSDSRSRSTPSTASARRGRCRGLLSQPIHRDDVINGKFAAGLAVIGLVLLTIGGLIAGVRDDPARASSRGLRRCSGSILWLGVTSSTSALWLAFGLLLSVVVRRAATSALIGFGVWLLAGRLRRPSSASCWLPGRQ